MTTATQKSPKTNTTKDRKMSDRDNNFMDSALTGLVYNYLKSTPQVPQSLVESFKEQFRPPVLPPGSPTIEEIYSHLLQNTLNGYVFNYLKSDPQVPQNLVESFKEQFHPSILPEGSPTLEEIYSRFLISTSTRPISRLILKPFYLNDIQTKSRSRQVKQLISSTQSTTTTSNQTDEATLAFLAWSRWDRSVSKNNPKICIVCDRNCHTPSELKVHLYTHMNPEEKKIVESGWKHVCEICSHRFLKASGLSLHNIHHTGDKPMTCPWVGCGKTFPHMGPLNRHFRSHSEIPEIRCPFQCHCGKHFARKGNFVLHLKCHVGIRDHECGVCGKRFITRRVLQGHVDSAHKGIRHQCRYCQKLFMYKRTARDHEKTFHKDEMEDAEMKEQREQ